MRDGNPLESVSTPSTEDLHNLPDFFRITQYIGDTHNARTLIPMNTRTQTLPLGAFSVTTGASLSTGTSPTTESTNTFKSREIRSHGESNPGPKVLPELL
jgi:hypothetical protein